MTAVWDHSKQGGGALVLMLAIADYAHDDGGGARPSIPTLAKKTRMTPRNVNLLIARLVAAGELEVVVGGGLHNTNAYRLTLPGLGPAEDTETLKSFQGETTQTLKPASVKKPANPEKPGKQTLKFPAANPEKPGDETLKPASADPLTDPSMNQDVKPESVSRTRARPTIDTYQPSPDFLAEAEATYPQLDLPRVIARWRLYRKANRRRIDDFDADLLLWLDKERPATAAPARGAPPPSNEAAKFERTIAALATIGGRHAAAHVPSQPGETGRGLLGGGDPGEGGGLLGRPVRSAG